MTSRAPLRDEIEAINDALQQEIDSVSLEPPEIVVAEPELDEEPDCLPLTDVASVMLKGDRARC